MEAGGDAGKYREEGPPSLDPLKIKLIVDKIWSNLSFQDLCSVRLVSKQWYWASESFWLEKAPEKHLYVDDFPAFLDQFHDPSHSYSEFEYNGVRKYEKFRLEFSTGGEPDQGLLEDFMRPVGASVKRLRMEFLTFSNKDSLMDILSAKFTPFVESLWVDVDFTNQFTPTRQPPPERDENHRSQLKSLELHFGDTNREIPVEWLVHHPNLECFSVICYAEQKEFILEFTQKLLQYIAEIRQKNGRFRLKRLEIQRVPIEGHACRLLMNRLQESKFPLESLAIEVGNYEDPPDLVADLMRLHLSTLKIFKITQISNSEFYELHPPFTASLHVLRVDGAFFRNLAFLKSLPNLRTLRLRCESEGPVGLIAATKDEDLADFVMKVLTYFELEEEETCSPEDFQKLKRWMPKLSKLKMRLSDDTFRMVCEFWPFLEYLRICGTEVTDNVITGRNADGYITTPPKINSLEKLKYIELRDYDMEESFVSSFSLVHTFIRLPSLESFSIGDYYAHKDETAKFRRVMNFECLPVPQNGDNEE